MALRRPGIVTNPYTIKRKNNAGWAGIDFASKGEADDLVLADKFVYNAPATMPMTVADTGWQTGSTWLADLGTWTSTGNIYATDGVFAQVVVGAANEGSGYVGGFTGLSVPSGAYILGIEVAVVAKTTAGTCDYTYAFTMSSQSFTGRGVAARNPDAGDTVTALLDNLTYGGRGDVWDGFDTGNDNIRDRDWASTDFSTFNAYVAFGSTAGCTVQVDSVKVRVTYSTTAAATGSMKVWNGSAWVLKPVKWYNGTTWVTKPLKRWNGSAWVTTL